MVNFVAKYLLNLHGKLFKFNTGFVFYPIWLKKKKEIVWPNYIFFVGSWQWHTLYSFKDIVFFLSTTLLAANIFNPILGE